MLVVFIFIFTFTYYQTMCLVFWFLVIVFLEQDMTIFLGYYRYQWRLGFAISLREY